jgi:hypothetical protein
MVEPIITGKELFKEDVAAVEKAKKLEVERLAEEAAVAVAAAGATIDSQPDAAEGHPEVLADLSAIDAFNNDQDS